MGVPFFFEHFPPLTYGHHPQNWAVVQDQRGLIYVANNDGVLEYDGAAWRFIPTATNTVVRSLAADAEGRLYVGAVGDFGVLEPDSTGVLRYRSLIDNVAEEDRVFQDVWATHAAGEGVYFQTYERLFRWDGHAMTVWKSLQGFRTSFLVGGQFYVREHNVGLLRMTGDSLEQAPGGERFSQVPIFMMVPYDDGRILIGTREAGLLLYDGVDTAPLPTGADAYLQDYQLYHGCALPGGHFALATLGGGVVVVDRQGRLVHMIDAFIGLPDGWVNFVYGDAQGGLWMALHNDGIARVDVPSQLSYYDEDFGLEGLVNFIQRYQDTLYVGTGTGLFKLEPELSIPDRPQAASLFSTVLDHASRLALPLDSVMFVATESGLVAIRGDEQEQVTDEAVFVLLDSDRLAGQVYVGMEGGLALLRHTPEGWAIEPSVEAGGSAQNVIGKAIYSMAEQADGTLWLSTADGDLIRLRFANDEAPMLQESFDETDGLPPGPVVVSSIAGEVVFMAEQGIYRFGAQGEDPSRFYQDRSLLPAEDSDASTLRSFVMDDDNLFWMVFDDRIEIAFPQPDGSYRRETPPGLYFRKEKGAQVYVEDDGIAWIGNGADLIRYEPGIRKTYDAAFPALVRRVVETGTERVIFGGAAPASGQPTPTLASTANNVRFEVAAPSYNNVRGTQYQYFLEGFDENWSPWTYQTRKVYLNLKGRRYRFLMRARNAQGIVSEEAAFAFRILPPWYRTWWAYGLYLMLLVGAAVLFRRYRIVVEENKRAQEQVRELARERLVNERLQQANKRLQEANEGLLQVNKLKDEFLATTSHELRTPLTAILGFTSVLQEELSDPYQEFLDPIKSNGQRLLHTVNSLLELAKLRAGMMEAHREVLDVGDVAAEVIRLLAPLADQKALSLDLARPPQALLVHLDRRFLERILDNLIGNAIKFTEEGRVRVAVER